MENRKLKYLPVYLLLTGAAFVFFWPCLLNGFIHWDDYLLLVQNPLIAKPGISIAPLFQTVVEQIYIPLTLLTFDMEHALAGMNPFIYHLDNLLLHLASSLAIFHLVIKLNYSLRCALFTSLIFLIHPMHAESVAWVSERKDVLYVFLYLLSMHQYLNYLKSNHPAPYTFALILGLLSMLAKPMALTLPLIFWLLDWHQGRKLSWKLFADKIPFFLYIIPLALITAGLYTQFYLPSVMEALLVLIWTCVFYIVKFFIPIGLTPLYVLPQPVLLSTPSYFISLVTFFVLAVSVWRWRMNRVWIFACGYYLLSIFVVLRTSTTAELVNVADHYMYLPSMGFSLWAAYYLDHGLAWCKTRALYWQRIFWAILIIIALWMGLKTSSLCKLWGNEENFWLSIAERQPHYLAFNNLGHHYARLGIHDLAIEHYTKALGLKPEFDHWIYQNIGIEYFKRGDYAQALSHYDRSLNLNPKSAEAHYLKASVYEHLRDFQQALAQYSMAIQFNPAFAHCYHNRAIIYARRGELNKAVDDLTRAIDIIPDFWTAYFMRGVIYAIEGSRDAALADFNTVLRLKPGNAQAVAFKTALEQNQPIQRILVIPDGTYDQPQWDSVGYSNYLPDKKKFHRLDAGKD